MEKKKKFIIDTVYFLILAVLVYLGVKYAIPILMPFLIAFIFAVIINYPVRWISGKLHIDKKPVSLFITAGFFVTLAVLIMFAGNRLISFAGEVIIKIPEFYRQEILPLLNTVFHNLETKAVSVDPAVINNLEEYFNTITRNFGQYISDFSVKAVKYASGYAAGIPSFMIKLIITVVATFFMAVDYDKITGFIIKLLPEKGKNLCLNIKQYTIGVIFAYIKSYSLLMFITFVELSAGLLLLKIPYAILIALIIAIFDILPILGTGGILIPWAVIAALLGNYKLTVGILILYLVITAVRNTIEPKIVGRQIGIPTLAALISMFIGLKLFGLIGLIGLPVALSILINLDKNGIIKLFRKGESSS